MVATRADAATTRTEHALPMKLRKHWPNRRTEVRRISDTSSTAGPKRPQSHASIRQTGDSDSSVSIAPLVGELPLRCGHAIL